MKLHIQKVYNHGTFLYSGGMSNKSGGFIGNVMGDFLRKFGIGNILKKRQPRAYFDYASITPVDERVLKYMNEVSRKFSANPSSIYREGVEAGKVLNSARAEVAGILEVHSDEIIFTSGGTESNNLALVGVVQGLWATVERTFGANNKTSTNVVGGENDLKVTLRPHIVITSIEHPSIREVADFLKTNGVDVTVVPVEQDGVVLAKKIQAALRAQTVLVSVMYVNNEIGTIQPIAEIAKVIRAYKKSLGRGLGNGGKQSGQGGAIESWPYLHTDACQAACFLPLRVPSLGVDLMTLDSSKFYGPRSTGVLYVRRGIKLISQLHGGDQERGKRAGTEDVVSACGFARALSIAVAERDRESARLSKMRDELIVWLLKIPQKNIILNGSHEKRVPNNINVCIEGADAEFLVLQLDAKGVAVSSVTTCQNLKEESSSYVIGALGESLDPHDPNREYYKKCATSSLRITLGRFTTEKEIEVFKKAFESLI